MKLLMKVLSFLHISLYRGTGGRVGQHALSFKFLLLTTTGRKSGKPRLTPLLYFDHEDGYLVVASNGGQDIHPGWYYNLTVHPRVELQVGRQRMQALARQAGPEERKRLWVQYLEGGPFYPRYQHKTTREIPLILLEPQDPLKI